MQVASTITRPAVAPKPAPALPWANKFVGTPIFAVGFPGFGQTLVYADSVIGSPVGYASLEDAREAVAILHPMNPNETDPNKVETAVAYLSNGYGGFAAVDTGARLAHTTMFRKRLSVVDAYSPLTEAVVRVENWRGDVLRNRGV